MDTIGTQVSTVLMILVLGLGFLRLEEEFTTTRDQAPEKSMAETIGAVLLPKGLEGRNWRDL